MIGAAAVTTAGLILFGYGVLGRSAPAMLAGIIILLAGIAAALAAMALRYRRPPLAPARTRPPATAITPLGRLLNIRPGCGWGSGLLGTGLLVIAGLAAVIVALAVIAGITAVLWLAGQVHIAVVDLAYAGAVLAGTGYAAGRSARLHARLTRPPWAPAVPAWRTSPVGIDTGLTWERDNPGCLTADPVTDTGMSFAQHDDDGDLPGMAHRSGA